MKPPEEERERGPRGTGGPRGPRATHGPRPARQVSVNRAATRRRRRDPPAGAWTGSGLRAAAGPRAEGPRRHMPSGPADRRVTGGSGDGMQKEKPRNGTEKRRRGKGSVSRTDGRPRAPWLASSADPGRRVRGKPATRAHDGPAGKPRKGDLKADGKAPLSTQGARHAGPRLLGRQAEPIQGPDRDAPGSCGTRDGAFQVGGAPADPRWRTGVLELSSSSWCPPRPLCH